MNPKWLDPLGKIRAGIIGDEAALHRAVTAVLTAAGVKFAHEVTFGQDGRIDFTVEDNGYLYGIECKVHPGGMDVWRQLERYSLHCDFLVLITTKPVARVIAPMGHRSRGLWVLELWKNF